MIGAGKSWRSSYRVGCGPVYRSNTRGSGHLKFEKVLGVARSRQVCIEWLWKHCLFCRDCLQEKGDLYTPGARPALLATPCLASLATPCLASLATANLQHLGTGLWHLSTLVLSLKYYHPQ